MSRVDVRAAREAAAAVQLGALPVMPAAATSRTPPDTVAQTPSRYRELVDKLRKLATLREAGVISELEHKERKIDLISDVASGLGRDEADDLLFDLLPLLQQGTITEEDIEFIKSLGK
jgi:hypothetical protein